MLVIYLLRWFAFLVVKPDDELICHAHYSYVVWCLDYILLCFTLLVLKPVWLLFGWLQTILLTDSIRHRQHENTVQKRGVTIHRTGPHRAGNDWLCHFDDELKRERRANYPQLTKEMNPSRRSWWVGDGRIQCFLLIQLKPKHRGIHCYALILRVTVVEVK